VTASRKVAQRSPIGGAFQCKCQRGPECSNGIRDRGRRIKDLRTRRQLRLKDKWTSQQIDRKTFYEISRGKIVKRAPGMYIGLRQGRNWTLWRGRPPLKRKKEHGAGAGDVEAPAATTTNGIRDNKTGLRLTMELLGTSALKEGADVAVGE
jgi:hypothetical protein